jgi:mono/diheme cytochrome c family protein
MKMKTKTSLFAIVLLGASVLSFAQDLTDAKTVFTKNCVLCHGTDGRSQTAAGKTLQAADLTAPGVQGQSDGQIRDALAKGKGKMPAYGPALGGKGLDAMVKYIRTLKAK